MQKAKSYRQFRGMVNSQVRDKLRGAPDVRRCVNVAAIHLMSEVDDLKLCEGLLRDLSEAECRDVCNAAMGRNGYTPLFRAAFKGSLKMTKLLCGYGADVNAKNSHGETVMAALDLGQAAQIAAMPSNDIFIRERFKECGSYLSRKMQAPIVPTKIRCRIPRRLQIAAIRIKWWWRRHQRRRLESRT